MNWIYAWSIRVQLWYAAWELTYLKYRLQVMTEDLAYLQKRKHQLQLELHNTRRTTA